MTRRKLDKIKRELAALRYGRHRALAFQRVAKRLGRKRNSKRGSEPMWESDAFPDLFPLAIPDHGGGRDISPGVQRTLLDLMEEDVHCSTMNKKTKNPRMKTIKTKRTAMNQGTRKMTPAEFLKRPYSRVVVPESDGTFRGEIMEFPGCIAAGDTAEETLARLEGVAAIAAHMDGVSLNSFIANSVAERVGERSRQAFTSTRTVNFSFHVAAGPGAALTQIPFENTSSLKQVATSANRQLLGFPFWQKEAVNA
jgi:hypothetical protein